VIDTGTSPFSFACGQLNVTTAGPVTVSWKTSHPANVQWAIAGVRLRATP
jgi:hypothetical protein